MDEQWSMDLATLMRIDGALQALNVSHSKTDILAIRLFLKVLRLECLPHLSDKEKKIESSLWDKIKSCKIGYNTENDLYVQKDILGLFDSYEIFLRQALMDHQLLMKKGQTFMQMARS